MVSFFWLGLKYTNTITLTVVVAYIKRLYSSPTPFRPGAYLPARGKFIVDILS
jgi:hypothetical protein